jgi:predicted TIM-barrel fold metal-dependent hydrolase
MSTETASSTEKVQWVPSQEPDPERRDHKYLIVSVDDHVVEPPHLFEGRLPAKYAERAPRVVDMGTASEGWLVEGRLVQTPGAMATYGRARADRDQPIRFDEMRPSAYDIHARIRDMNIDGVYASLCFPSHLTGFGGVRLQSLTDDRDYCLALMRAWNDWHLEDWCSAYPGRMIPCQLVWLADPVLAAEEVRRNAARGFRAISFPEQPHEAGFPSLYSGYWDPLVAACAETDTVVCVHTGSAGKLPAGAADAPVDAGSALFGAGYALTTTVDWLYSLYTVRYPGLKIITSEGGIGWVPSLLDRLDHTYSRNEDRRGYWTTDLKPSEVLLRDFWFCLVDEPSAMDQRYRIGIDHICFETDFPHLDSSWPNSQALLASHMKGLPSDEIEKMTWKNAADLFRVDVPPEIQKDPNAF